MQQDFWFCICFVNIELLIAYRILYFWFCIEKLYLSVSDRENPCTAALVTTALKLGLT